MPESKPESPVYQQQEAFDIVVAHFWGRAEVSARESLTRVSQKGGIDAVIDMAVALVDVCNLMAHQSRDTVSAADLIEAVARDLEDRRGAGGTVHDTTS